MMFTSILAAFASSLGPATQICTALDAWGFWSVILSSLPMAVLVMSRLLTPKVSLREWHFLAANLLNDYVLGSGR